jgi:hypothetical protein
MCTFSLAVKRPGRVADHSRLYNAELRKEWNYVSTPPLGFHAVQKDNFTFTFATGDR